MSLKDLPSLIDILLTRGLLANRHSQYEPTLEHRVGDENLAPGVDPFEEPLVDLVAALYAEADDREMARGAQLPTGLIRNRLLKARRKSYAATDVLLQPVAPVTAQNRPQLQRAEPSTQ